MLSRGVSLCRKVQGASQLTAPLYSAAAASIHLHQQNCSHFHSTPSIVQLKTSRNTNFQPIRQSTTLIQPESIPCLSTDVASSLTVDLSQNVPLTVDLSQNVRVEKCLNTEEQIQGTQNYISQVRWKNNPVSNSLPVETKQRLSDTSIPTLNIVPNLIYNYVQRNIFNLSSLGASGPGMLGISGSLSRNQIYHHGNFSPHRSSGNVLQKTCREEIQKSSSHHSTECGTKEQIVLENVLNSILSDVLRSDSNTTIAKRYYHTTSIVFKDEPSSQVEVTVNALKEKAEEASKQHELELIKESSITETSVSAKPISGKLDSAASISTAAGSVIDNQTASQTVATADIIAPSTEVEKSIWVRIKEEVLHYYHGFRLLFVETNICLKYCKRVLYGEKLSRREYRQLVRTTGDLFRLVPFSVFIIVPFMELLLPVAIKLFPGMLPSTFETANEKEAKMKKRLKVKLEMAKFLQETLDTMPLEGKGHRSKSAKEFVLFFEKVRRTGERVTNEEILKFSKLFADSITLDSLSRPQLTAICQLLDMQPFGTSNFLRFQLRMKLRMLKADDKWIAVEGVESLSSWELQQACRSRGMRAYGMTDVRLAEQLRQWLELSLDKQVPQSLLLLSRTLFLPDNVDPNVTLAATISQLPEEVKTHAKAAIGKREGKIDNRTRLEVLKSEEKRIKQDRKELEDERKKKAKEDTKKKGELGIGVAEVLSYGAPYQEALQHPVTAEAILSKGVKIAKATVTTTGELKEDKDELVDKAPTLVDTAPLLSVDADVKEATKEQAEELSTQDLAEVEEAIETIGAQQHRLIIEEQELSELKEEMQDYKEDIQDFKKVISQFPERADLRESKAAQRLFNKINRLIAQAEPVIDALSDKTLEMKKVVDAGEADEQHEDTLVNLEDLVTHLRQVADTPDSTKLTVIKDVLTAMDTDNDGAIKLEHILKALELLSEDQVSVPPKLFEEVIQVMAKEEQLETKLVVQQAINASKSGLAPAAVTDAIPAAGAGTSAKSATSSTADKTKAEQAQGR